MVRRSQFEHLKPTILAEFQSGAQPKDVCSKFPQIPGSTIREWFKPFRAEFVLHSASSANQSGEAFSSAPPPTTMGQRSHLSVVDGDADEGNDLGSDIRWIKRQLRNILRSEKNNAIRIQGLNTYLRAVQIENSMPKSKPDIDLTELSDQDLERIASGEPIEAIASL